MSWPARISAALSLIALCGCASQQTARPSAEGGGAADIQEIRFNAVLTGSVPPRGSDGRYHPIGSAVPAAESDPVLGAGRPAAYATIIESNTDGKGGFVDEGSINFAGGKLLIRGVYPTHNEATGIDGVLQTVMVEKVVGGTDRFNGATGYVLLNSTLDHDNFSGSLNGIVFLKLLHDESR